MTHIDDDPTKTCGTSDQIIEGKIMSDEPEPNVFTEEYRSPAIEEDPNYGGPNDLPPGHCWDVFRFWLRQMGVYQWLGDLDGLLLENKRLKAEIEALRIAPFYQAAEQARAAIAKAK